MKLDVVDQEKDESGSERELTLIVCARMRMGAGWDIPPGRNGGDEVT